MTHFGRETVGAAYIRILADMSDFDRSIKDDASVSRGEGGRFVAKAFNRGFKEEMAKEGIGGTSLEDSLKEKRGRIEAIAQRIANEDISGSINKGVGNRVRVGEIISENLKRGLLEGRIEFANLGKAAQDELLPALRQVRAEEEATARAFKDLNTRGIDEQVRRMANVTNETQKIDEGLRRLISTQATARQAAEKLGVTTGDRFKGMAKDGEQNLGNLTRKLRNWGEEADRAGNKFGKAFGEGARNNFVNFIGKIFRGIGELPGILLKAGSSVTGFFGNLSQGFTEAGGGLKGLLSVGGELTGVFAKGGAGIAVFAVVLAGIVLIAGPVVAAISAIAGAVVALTGAIAFGLAGAIGAAAPLLLGLVGILAIATLGISGQIAASKKAQTALDAATKSVDTQRRALAAAKPGSAAYTKASLALTDALKKQHDAQVTVNNDVGTALKPLTALVTTARTVVQQHMFAGLAADAKLLSPVLRSQILPLLAVMADSVGGFFHAFIRGLTSPSFIFVIGVLRDILPKIMDKLGESFVNVFTGLGGVFRALLPFGLRLATIIASITDRFTEWANSVGGQNKIEDFMNRAWSAASKLWTTVTLLWKVISDLFSAGQSTGQGFLDSINSSLATFDRHLNSKEGRDSLAEWFRKAKQFIGDLGPILANIVQLFNTLNTREAQQNLHDFLDITAKTITVINLLMTVGKLVLPVILPIFTAMVVGAAHVGDAWNAMVNAIVIPALRTLTGAWLDFVSGVLQGAATAFGWIPGIGPKLRGLSSDFDTWAKGIKDKLNNLGKPTPAPVVPKIDKAAEDDAWRRVHGFATRVQVPIGPLMVPAAENDTWRRLHGFATRIQVPIGPLVEPSAAALAKWRLDQLGVGRSPLISPQINQAAFSGVWSYLNSFAAGISVAVGGHVAPAAAGMLLTHPRVVLAGEAGAEAIVPLNRPLHMVDPAVRWLSAIAQGKDNKMASGGMVGAGKTLNVGGITVNAASADPNAVVSQFLNRIVAMGYS